MRLHSLRCRLCATELPPGDSGPMCPRCRALAAERLTQDQDESRNLSTTDRPTRTYGDPVPAPPPSPPPEPGPTRMGDYDLIEEIARGGMGVVYKARQRSLNRIVALKVLPPGSVGDPARVQRFRTEAEAVAALEHPHIINIFGIGEHAGAHYFSMEYVPGGDLAQRGRGGRVDPRMAARYVQRVAEAVHHAHQRGILHRDLKPSNVLLDDHDEPRVTDFGIAKLTHDSRDLTRTTDTLGTPSFMAPEQVRAERGGLSVATDVYALGGILYFLLTGRAPFEGETAQQILWSVYYDEPAAPSRLARQPVPVDLETICLKCLQKEPERRYGSALALAEDLNRFLDRRPIAARPISRLECAWLWVRRNPTLATLSLALVLALGGGFTAQYLALGKARQARSNAEGLIEFMNEELAVRLRPLGRLDLLAEVNGKVEEYFRAESEGTANAGSLEREARFYQNAAAIQRELGNLPQAERLATTSLDLFQRLNRQQPASNASRCDRAELRLLLFRIARLSGRDREAEVHGQAAQQLLETARRAEPGDRRASVALAEVLMETGSLWLDRKNRTRADEGFVQAAALLQEVLQGEPDDPEAKRLLAETHYHRGLACQRSDQPAAALEQFTAFLSELKEAGNPGAPDRRRQYELAVAYGRVGEALYGLKQEAAALENFQQFHRLAGDLVEHDPANVLWQQAWAQSLAWLGLLARSQPEESALAGDYLRQAREVYLRLVAHNPNWESWQVHLARLDQELASWHDSRGEVEAAEQVLTSAVTSRLQSARLRPDDFQRYHRLGDALLALAQHHHEHQGLAAAQLFLSEAMTMLPAEFAGAGSEGWWRWPLSRLHATRAHFLYLGGEWSAGLQELNRALDLRQALLEVAADTPQVRQAIPNTFYWITEFHRAAQDLPGAVASAERALDWAAAQLPTDEGRNDLAALCLLLVRPDLQADTRLHARARHLWERCLEERFRDPAPQSPGEVELADRLRQALGINPPPRPSRAQ